MSITQKSKDKLKEISWGALSGIDAIHNSYELTDLAIKENIPGDVVECGVYAGVQSAAMALAIKDNNSNKNTYLFDSFEGSPLSTPSDAGDISGYLGINPDETIVPSGKNSVSLDQVRDYFYKWGLLSNRIKFIKGWFHDTLHTHSKNISSISVLRIDCHTYLSTKECLRNLHPLVSMGGYVILGDHNLTGCRKAAEEYFAENNISCELVQVPNDGAVYYYKKTSGPVIKNEIINNDNRIKKLLIKFPTRNRPDKFKEVFEKYHGYLSGKHHVKFIVSMDHDDNTMNNPNIKNYLSGKKNVSFYYGNSKTKVQAINADMNDLDFDVLLLASDDMIPEQRNYDDIIMSDMFNYFPDLDGALWYADGRVNEKLCTLSIMGINLYKMFGYIYHSQYVSLYCDNEFHDVCTRMNKLKYIPNTIIKHGWADFIGRDSLYQRNESFYKSDGTIYSKRKALGFPKSFV